MPSAASSTYRNSRVAWPVPQTVMLSLAALPGLDALADQRRDDV